MVRSAVPRRRLAVYLVKAFRRGAHTVDDGIGNAVGAPFRGPVGHAAVLAYRLKQPIPARPVSRVMCRSRIVLVARSISRRLSEVVDAIGAAVDTAE